MLNHWSSPVKFLLLTPRWCWRSSREREMMARRDTIATPGAEYGAGAGAGSLAGAGAGLGRLTSAAGGKCLLVCCCCCCGQDSSSLGLKQERVS